MLKKASLLTRPTPAATSPARPESAKTASSPKDAPCPRQDRNSAVDPRFTFHASRFTVPGSEVRTMLADFFSILLRQRLPMLLDQRLLRSHGWLERSGWIYCIRKGAGCSILAFEFFQDILLELRGFLNPIFALQRPQFR